MGMFVYTYYKRISQQKQEKTEKNMSVQGLESRNRAILIFIYHIES